MKKLLSLMGAILLTGTSTSSLVACGERTVASLDDTSSDIKSASGNHMYHDITHWASDVITVNSYKDIFTHNMSNAFAEGTVLDYNHFVEYVNYKGNPNDSNLVFAPFQLLANYQKGSNTGDVNGDLADVQKLEQYFKITLYDQDDKIIAWSHYGSVVEWLEPTIDKGKLQAKLNTTTSVYVMSFIIGITPTTLGVAAGYVGARTNVVVKDGDNRGATNIGLFFSKDPEQKTTGVANPLVVDSKDGKFSDGKVFNSKDGQWYMNKKFDYRYAVKFFFSVS